jgi:hypothetical protein
VRLLAFALMAVRPGLAGYFVIGVVVVDFPETIAFLPTAIWPALLAAATSGTATAGMFVAFVVDLLVLRPRLLVDLLSTIGHVRYPRLLLIGLFPYCSNGCTRNCPPVASR